jgi:hypothetical protein
MCVQITQPCLGDIAAYYQEDISWGWCLVQLVLALVSAPQPPAMRTSHACNAPYGARESRDVLFTSKRPRQISLAILP